MSDKIKDGGPAFPINNNDVITIVTNNGNHPEGMSLRDYFAAKAMQSFIMMYKTGEIEKEQRKNLFQQYENDNFHGYVNIEFGYNEWVKIRKDFNDDSETLDAIERIAELSFFVADAMLEARGK